MIHSGLSSFARQLGHFIKHHQVTGALSAKNTAHHRREIRRLPAVGPRMVNPFLLRAIASFWSGNDTSDLSAQRLTAQAVLAQVAAQPRSRHPRIGFHVSINIHMLGNCEESRWLKDVVGGRAQHAAMDSGQTGNSGLVVLLHKLNPDVPAPYLNVGHTGGAGTGKRVEHNGIRVCKALNQRLQAGNGLFGLCLIR